MWIQRRLHPKAFTRERLPRILRVRSRHFIRAPHRAFALVVVAVALGGAACSGSGSSGPASSSVAPTDSQASGETKPSAVPTTESVDLSRVNLVFGATTTRGKTRQATRLASGAFDNLPFTLKWAEFSSGDDALAAMLADRVDIQEAQPTALVVLAAAAATPWTTESSPVKVVGALRYGTPEGIQIVVPEGSPIRTVADLRGKKVAYSRGSSSQYFLVLALEKAGVTASDVTAVKMTMSDARAAFAAGSVDAIVAFDFNILPLFRQESLRVIARSADYDVPLYALITVRATLLEDPAYVEAIRIMLRRMSDVEGWVSANIDAASRLKEELDGVDPLDSEQIMRYGVSSVVPVSDELIASVVDQAKLFHAEGVIERLPDISVIFDRRYDLAS